MYTHFLSCVCVTLASYIDSVLIIVIVIVIVVATETDKTAHPYEFEPAIKIVIVVKWEQDNHAHKLHTQQVEFIRAVHFVRCSSLQWECKSEGCFKTSPITPGACLFHSCRWTTELGSNYFEFFIISHGNIATHGTQGPITLARTQSKW